MNRTQILICVCAVVLCYLWFDFATPRFESRGIWHYETNSSVVTPLHLIVWAIIIIVALLAYRAAGKK